MISITGRLDVVKEGTAYNLIFTDNIKHENFIQTAMYNLDNSINESIIWNIKDNEMYKVSIKDTSLFLEKVIRTISKGAIGYL